MKTALASANHLRRRYIYKYFLDHENHYEMCLWWQFPLQFGIYWHLYNLELSVDQIAYHTPSVKFVTNNAGLPWMQKAPRCSFCQLKFWTAFYRVFWRVSSLFFVKYVFDQIFQIYTVKRRPLERLVQAEKVFYCSDKFWERARIGFHRFWCSGARQNSFPIDLDRPECRRLARSDFRSIWTVQSAAGVRRHARSDFRSIWIVQSAAGVHRLARSDFRSIWTVQSAVGVR